jgi:hypothetical protein
MAVFFYFIEFAWDSLVRPPSSTATQFTDPTRYGSQQPQADNPTFAQGPIAQVLAKHPQPQPRHHADKGSNPCRKPLHQSRKYPVILRGKAQEDAIAHKHTPATVPAFQAQGSKIIKVKPKTTLFVKDIRIDKFFVTLGQVNNTLNHPQSGQ